ncbi:CusA/CzcA family heavy metal efflux RND transporter [Bacteroides graminisolvens]|jgi:cobalt-zinc-cadmium resistance protein CzcA|uniref:CusA/CzcA family heavy metal efflux RND transporter n=1 Tax=Bacteroides graminisolvens TaxID=477666 RepID=UPI0023F1E82E|nr:CusA/CzcA family heavy metal efflux RND transporter [Bacteroides graminisolvens]MDD3210869.1 CusA/CzcA family heavy metal efflux RND transporter [Bacteroides graminisolvens]
MIERIIHFSIKNKFIIGLFVVALIGWGTYSLTQLPIDATPDITNNQVQVISLAPSLAVQEVESSITAPIEVAVANIPNIIELRSISRLGLSVTTIVFKDNVDIYWARQQVGERLKEAEDIIPAGLAKIEMAPISTGLGEIYQYRLAVEKGYETKYTPMELRTLQDWTVRREMLGTTGVADINSYGGFVKQYEVAINPERLRSMNLTLTDIFDALERNNENTGSAYIDKKPTAYFIRGIGLVKSLEDIEKIVVKSNSSGIPILIRDIASVQYGNSTRYGAMVIDTTEAVGGVVMMLKGANANEVTKNVETRIETIQKSLPKGVKIEPFLNRSDLVGRAISTVARNLIEGALIVIFILMLFLGNMRAGLLVASVIPLSMLFAISMMNFFGVSGNLMSLGAIDFGLIVDGAVIIVESVIHRISMSKNHHQGITRLSQQQMDEEVYQASSRIRTAAAFGEIIILIVYMPILFLVGIEGKMFVPMAQVVSFAILGAFILSLTYVPMASALFLSKNTEHKPNFSDKLMVFFHKGFNPIIHFALKRKLLISVSVIALFLISLGVFSRLGGEFIPQLEEGDLAAGVITLQGGSLTNTVEQVQKANKILLDKFPEIKHAVCKIGAGEIPTDPTPMETGDYIITLKDKSEWTSAKTREELVGKMEEALIPLAGVKFEFQQPIQMRTNELLSGSKQDIAIKIFGDDLNTLADKASQVEKIIQKVQGVEDINVEKVTGLAQVQVEYNRDRLAQYGLSIAEVNRVLRTAFAGSQAGVVFDEEKRFGLVVRMDKDYRQSIDDVKNLYIALPNGGQIPFEQIASVEIKSGPAQVSRENTKRRITIGFNVRNRDVQSVIDDVTKQIDTKVQLPTGYYVKYGGQFEHLQAAKARLSIAVPVALLLIFVLLFFTFHSVKQTLLIYTAVPMSLIGGILALWIRGMNFSISAGVGFIALFGIAVLNGIVLIAEFNRLEKEGVSDITERVLKGLHTRLRPVIITAAVASLGFLPMALSTSAGAEVQKPLATVVIGGLITATLLTLIVLPIFYIFFSTFSFRSIFKRKSVKTLSILLILVVCSAGFNSINAQQSRSINLKQAIQMALDSNLSVRSSRYSVDVQKALKGASWDIPKTIIDGQYGQFNSYSKDNSFTVSQSFAFPTVYINQNKLAKANIKSSEWQLKTSQLEIATQVKQIYWQLAYLYSKQKLFAYQDSLYTGFQKAAELRAKTGETNRLEMISARSQSLEIKNQLQQINADLVIYNQKLQTILNIETTLYPADTVLHRIDYLPASDNSVLTTNPSVGYINQQVEVSRLEKKVESSRILPDLSIGYFSQTIRGSQDVNGIPRTFGAADRFTGIQVGIAVPLWFAPYSAKAKAAKFKEKVAQTNAEYYSKSLSGSYRSLMLEFSKNSNSVDYYEKQAIPEADLIIEQATRSYKAGAIDYLDYILSLNRALSIKQSYLDAQNNYNQTIISIDFITGKIF